jgi:hypothetical protein
MPQIKWYSSDGHKPLVFITLKMTNYQVEQLTKKQLNHLVLKNL